MSRNLTKRNYWKNLTTLTLAAALSVTLVYGCSKGKDNQQAGSAATAPAASSVSSAKEHFDKGNQLYSKGQLDEAVKEYELTVSVDPRSVEAYNNMGFVYHDKGDFDKAIDSQKKAVGIDQTYANAYYGLALSLEKKGDVKGALENWKIFMKLAKPQSTWWLKAKERIEKLEKK